MSFKKGVTTLAGGSFSYHVYLNLNRSSPLRIMDPSYLRLKAYERREKIELLRERIPTGDSLIYRGSEGVDEVLPTMKSGHIGRKPEHSKKSPSHDIVGYIRDNDSKYFLSFSKCIETVKPYTVGLSIIPKKGYIFVTALPKVYTIPQKLLFLNPKMFEQYDKMVINSIPMEEARAYQSIITMTKNNPEITCITGARLKDDWRSEVNKRMHSVIEVCGPGRILSPFMSSNQPAHSREWINPDFCPELVSMDIVFYRDESEYEDMNEKAADMGVSKKGERLLDLRDACAVMYSGQLDTWEAQFVTQETTKVVSVPKTIKPGDTRALLEYFDSLLKANPSIKLRAEHTSSFGL